jgi:hypothetical protein
VAYNGEIYRLGFEQLPYQTGTYTSVPVTFDDTVELRQLITTTYIPDGGSITATILGSNSEQKIDLQSGAKGYQFEMSEDQVRVRFNLEADNNGERPEITGYELIHLEESSDSPDSDGSNDSDMNDSSDDTDNTTG